MPSKLPLPPAPQEEAVYALLENPFRISTWASVEVETDDVQTAKHLAHCAGNKALAEHIGEYMLYEEPFDHTVPCPPPPQVSQVSRGGASQCCYGFAPTGAWRMRAAERA
eukprot:808539-Pyramimonas_sp.AAC.1